MNSRKQILWITQTAMLLAIALVSQVYLTNLLAFNALASQFAVGSIVNLCLVLSVLICGFFSGFSIAVCTPLIPFLLGRIVYPQQMIIVALGNLAIVFIFWLICRQKKLGENSRESVNWAAASVIGAVVKFLVLWLGMTKIFVNLVLKNDAALPAAKLEKMTAAIALNFTWSQLATALIGCILAYTVYKALKNVLFEKTTVKAKN